MGVYQYVGVLTSYCAHTVGKYYMCFSILAFQEKSQILQLFSNLPRQIQSDVAYHSLSEEGGKQGIMVCLLDP